MPRSNRVRSAFARLLIAACVVFFPTPASSEDRDTVVVRVGKMALTTRELQWRWQQLPAFQQKALGKTDLERAQTFVDQWIVPEMLLVQSASSRAALSNERKRAIQNSVLQQALAQQIRHQTDVSLPVTDADVASYLESHRQDFDKPERLRLNRILLATEAEALTLIHEVRGAPDYDSWRNLARDKSLDRATNLRGGELGFVAADGRSDIVELQVDSELFSAAARLKDGELGKAPVREGDKFAVVWRRGHMSASRADPRSVDSTIRAHLRELRAATAFDQLLTELRAKYVTDLNAARLDGVEFKETPSDNFQVATPK